MTDIKEGDLLWTPSNEVVAQANLTRYMAWLAETRGLRFGTYPDLWRWSVENLADFWSSIWDYFALRASQPAEEILPDPSMPGARWFPGMQLNYAENVLARMVADEPVFWYKAEERPLRPVHKREVLTQVTALAQALRDRGVRRGDRVVAYLPNVPEAMIAVLAATSLGAIWSSCAPDFGSRSVLDRFTQIEPTVLIAVDGYNFGGKTFDRRGVVAELQARLPTLAHTILVPHVRAAVDDLASTVLWDDALAAADPPAEIAFEQVPFDHPLWVLYSSGTTGLPKPIVHGHGGVLLESAKVTAFHNNLRRGDRFFWFSSTGWMMWNYLLGSTLTGCSVILYNGSPAYPDMNALWRLAEECGLTYFGTSAAFISACMKAGITPGKDFDLSAIRAVGSTGSPLSVDGFNWIYEQFDGDVALESLSGGTDICTAFVGGARIMPIYAGEIQGASLGAKVEAYDGAGRPVVGEVGELVITEPMPSMPVAFWNDPDGARYRASYFEMYPGVWRHGDWIKFNERGGCVIYGRSDSTINRHGVRMGTAELYRIVEAFPEIVDSLVIDLEMLGRESYLPLFVVMRDDETLDDDLRARIKQALREEVSPRHVPNDIFVIEQVPYTLSGKKMEVPVRRILLGQPVEQAAKRGAMRNPEAIDYFIDLAQRLAADRVPGD